MSGSTVPQDGPFTSDAPSPPAVATPSPSVTGPVAVILVLSAVALVIMVLRSGDSPAATWLAQYASTGALDPMIAEYAEEVLIVPFGALITVFVRLTLGIPMLGPFRPVLIATAFEFTGIWVGVGFAVGVMLIVAALRPRLKTDWLPYASRLSIILVIVVLLQVIFVFVASAMDWTNAVRSAFFPIIVLCMAADGFARVLGDSGFRDAAWRGTTTILIAVAIVVVFDLPGVADLLIRYPELMCAQIALIVALSRFLAPRWLEGWNPMKTGTSRRIANSATDE